jgi:branched-chain amino acid transport system ATP-binding protein
MALSTGASVVMLDEPTAGMSTEETAYIIELIRSVTADKTLLVVEHDMSVVFSLCDRISVLVYGQILATGAPDEIRSNAKVQAAYLGDAVVQETH